jgi:hypothetical protein
MYNFQFRNKIFYIKIIQLYIYILNKINDHYFYNEINYYNKKIVIVSIIEFKSCVPVF